MTPINQINLYGYNDKFLKFVELYDNKKLPSKILLSGQKGIGKSTLAFHFINFILSKDEEFAYDLKNFYINEKNRTFRLIQNRSNQNFTLIDVDEQKRSIDIQQIRNLIENLNKSSFNEKPRFILIDNIEYLNIYSINALLKTLEEPVKNTYFILINNNTKILPTLKSRCINFKIYLSNKNVIDISNQLLNANIDELFNSDFLNYYITPGKIYKLFQFSKDYNFDLKNISLDNFLSLLIDESYYKKDTSARLILFDFIELFLLKKIAYIYNDYSRYFLKKINNTKKYNLDEGSLFLEIKSKLLNG